MGKPRGDTLIRNHYEIETELAKRLMDSTKGERVSKQLYTKLYDELFSRVTYHDQLLRKVSAEETQKNISWQYGLVRRFVGKSSRFLEIGPGDCLFAFYLARYVTSVTAIDVSEVVTHSQRVPENFSLVLTQDGCSFPLASESIDVVYSNQLMEHLHPEDAIEQLQNILRVLKPKGHYICVTPNKVSGPWDISVYYDAVSKGFHLKEYSLQELRNLFLQAGFSRTRYFVGARGRYVRFPIWPVIALEKLLWKLPAGLRKRIAKSLLFRVLLGIVLVGVK